jgi:hypothetical protein
MTMNTDVITMPTAWTTQIIVTSTAVRYEDSGSVANGLADGLAGEVARGK